MHCLDFSSINPPQDYRASTAIGMSCTVINTTFASQIYRYLARFFSNLSIFDPILQQEVELQRIDEQAAVIENDVGPPAAPAVALQQNLAQA
jgi:hypothetical protein